MKRTRGEVLLLAGMTLGPAVLIAIELVIHDRMFSVMVFPVVVALLLLALAGVGFLSRPQAGDCGACYRSSPAQYVGPIMFAAGMLLIGPRLALPLFGLVFAKRTGAGWGGSLLTGACCALLIELMLVRILGHPIPWLPAWLLRIP